MDEIFERFNKMFEDMAFSGFFNPRDKHLSPRDEMLRKPEDEFSAMQTPEPWYLFPFYGDFVKPDMMDRSIYEKSLPQNDAQRFEKRDIIIDDQVADSPNVGGWGSSIRSWSSSFVSRKYFGDNGQVTEVQKRVVREPDGTEVHTTIERSSDGEKKHVIYKKPDGQQFSITDNDEPQSMISSTKQFPTEKAPSGWFSALRRWYQGN
uniref:Uncharacterized protein n=2 Tax=Trichobilharzia regenti TaxID=157069 RepID=A0AA85JXS8_TRIRE|nr:unnamed protein product [Trichobilharzia regenti]